MEFHSVCSCLLRLALDAIVTNCAVRHIRMNASMAKTKGCRELYEHRNARRRTRRLTCCVFLIGLGGRVGVVVTAHSPIVFARKSGQALWPPSA